MPMTYQKQASQWASRAKDIMRRVRMTMEYCEYLLHKANALMSSRILYEMHFRRVAAK